MLAWETRRASVIGFFNFMAKSRIINTRFWIDDYISGLDPIEKLLFLYFLTNPATEICGVYEIPLKTIATDTGIDKEMVEKVIKRFSKDNKILYSKGWVAIVNFVKHQSSNPSIREGVKKGLEQAPRELVDRLSQAVDKLSGIQSNSILSNLKNVAKATPFVLKDEIQKLKTDKRRHIQLIGEYLEEKSVRLASHEELQVALKRHLKSAVHLAKFGDERIGWATSVASKEYPDYTLETLTKILTR